MKTKIALLVLVLSLMLTSFAYAAAPTIQFTAPTPANGATVNADSFTAALSTSSPSQHYSFVDLDNSNTLWLQMDSATPQDQSGSNNHVTSNTGASLVSGKFGQAISFDGTNNLVVADSSSLKSEDLTVSVWVKPDALNDFTSVFMKSSGFDWDDGYGLYILEGNIIFFVNHYDNGKIVSPINSGEWTHVVGVYNSSYLKMYINGEMIGEGELPAPIIHSDSPLLIGMGAEDENSRFQGSVDEMTFFSRELSASEVRALYDSSANQYSGEFKTLSTGSHTITGYAVASDGLSSSTEQRTVNVDASGTPSEVQVNACGTLSQSTTYVLTQDLTTTGTCFTITADNVVLDGNGFRITGDSGSGDIGVYASGRDNLVVRELDIYNFETGIYLQTQGSTISSNELVGNEVGIQLVDSNTNTVSSNSVSQSDRAILLISSNDNTVSSNTVSDNEFGIALEVLSSNNEVSDSALSNNVVGIAISGPSNEVSDVTISGSADTAVRLFDSTSTDNIFRNVQVNSNEGSLYDLAFVDAGENFNTADPDGTQVINSNFNKLYIASPGGRIFFANNAFGSIQFTEDISGTAEISQDIVLGSNRAFIDSSVAGINKAARITLLGIPASDENVLFKDGSACPSEICTLQSGLSGTVVFDVTEGGEYSINVGDNPTPVDTTAPQITIFSPEAQTYSVDSYLVDLGINEDGVCEYSLDSGLTNKTLSTSNNRDFTATESEVENGEYTLTAYCRDNAGNSNSAEVSFTVDANTVPADTTTPTVTIESPTSQIYETSGVDFRVSLNEAGICQYTLNSGLENSTMDSNEAGTLFTASENLEDGEYTFRAYCSDSAGNVNNGQSIVFYVNTSLEAPEEPGNNETTNETDVTAPVITIQSPVAGTRTTNSYPVIIQTNEMAMCVYSLDSGVTNKTLATSSNRTFTAVESNIANGAYTLTAYCEDFASNRNSTSVSFSVNVQTETPNNEENNNNNNGGSGSGRSSGGGGSSGSRSSTTASANRTANATFVQNNSFVNLPFTTDSSNDEEIINLPQGSGEEVESQASTTGSSRITGAVINAFEGKKPIFIVAGLVVALLLARAAFVLRKKN